MVPLYNERILYKSTLYSFKKDFASIKCTKCHFCRNVCGIMTSDSWFCCNAIISGKYVTINQ